MMLDAHPDLAIPSESQFIPPVTRACQAAVDPTSCFVEKIVAHDRWGDFQIDSGLLRERIAALQPFDLSTAFRTVFQLYADKFAKPRWGDKTTTYMLHMPLIQELFPEAYFIHLIR